MNRAMDIELMRLLHGELPDEQARALRARLEREPELAAAWARLERTWSGLELPPAAPAPPGYGQRVLAQARRQSRPGNSLSWGMAPAWVRASAAAALAAGLALGIGAGLGAAGAGNGAGTRPPEPDEPPAISAAEADAEPSLAETYWDSLEDLEGSSSTTDGERL
jgi:anti-sigma factor RsiW